MDGIDMEARKAPLTEVDPDIADAIQLELGRQRHNLELIASENFVSQAVLQAVGSVMTNKYAEGYPGKRYYGGCEHVDIAESIAIERAKKLFGAEHANVQAHSGSQANMAVYFAVLKPGDTILGMNLSQGGHLTHGSPRSFSGQMYNVLSYSVRRDTEQIDYDEVEKLAMENHPKLIIAGASSYPRFIDYAKFREIADKAGALFMVDMAHPAGLIAAGLHPSPVPHADFVTSTTHKTLRGPRGGMVLCKAEHAAALDKSIMPGIQGGPFMHVIAAKAVCYKEAMSPSFHAYQRQVVNNAVALAAGLTKRGLRLVSGGTDNHLMLVDLTSMGVTGMETQVGLDRMGITVNKNMIPYDTQKVTVGSGIRMGVPAVTTRGMSEPEMDIIAELVCRGVKSLGDDSAEAKVREDVRALTDQFPLYTYL